LDAYSNRATYAFRFRWDSFVRLLLFGSTLFGANVLPAAEPATDSEATAAEQLKQLNDQTIIGSRVFLDTEWDHFEHGAEKATWTLAGLWGWRVSACQDWAVRLKLPFAYAHSGEISDHVDTGGIGDVEFGTGTAFRLNKRWRTAAGLELHADTASDPSLAEKVWRLKSAWGIAHDVTDWLTLTFNADYSHSIAEEHNVPPQHYLELFLPGTIILPHDWSIFATYKTKIDFEDDDRWTHRVNAGVAKRLPNVPVVLSAALEKPLNGGAEKFQVNFTIVYYFQQYHSAK
jgi:hypothetical protein